MGIMGVLIWDIEKYPYALSGNNIGNYPGVKSPPASIKLPSPSLDCSQYCVGDGGAGGFNARGGDYLTYCNLNPKPLSPESPTLGPKP